MEQDLVEKQEALEKEYYKLSYNNQNVKNLKEFQEWYKKTTRRMEEENAHINQGLVKGFDFPIFLVLFCEACSSYTICKLYSDIFFSCALCHNDYCIGCKRERSDGNPEYCLQGFIKAFYLRFKYERTRKKAMKYSMRYFYYVSHIIFCLFCVPFYLGYKSHYIGLLVHREGGNGLWDLFETDCDDDGCIWKYCLFYLFCFFRGFIMFPYVIFFFPFMFIALIPSVFSFSYYKRLLIGFINIFEAGSYPFQFDYDNDNYNYNYMRVL